jgi:cysteine desulfurase
MTIYLDNNATTRPVGAVAAAMMEAMREYWANPSSVHRAGQSVRQQVELARQEVCRLINCADRELIFTSGGTEGADLAISGSMAAQSSRRVLVTTKLEHSAVRETADALAKHGSDVAWASVRPNGLVDLDALATLVSRRAKEIALVSIMWANNETGVVQPIEAIGAMCREHGVRFHTDATQWVGKMPTDVATAPVDLLSFAAHKFHGPKGVGALYVRRGVRVERRLSGGPQERDRRGGTENVVGIIGMGVAARLAREWLATDARDRLADMRDGFEQAIVKAAPPASINGEGAPRLWNTSNIGFARLEAEAILLLLSERGVYASAGAACSSGSLEPSPVLLAMGIPPEIAHGSIRFSLSRETSQAELDEAVRIVSAVVERLRRSTAAVV